MSCPTCDHTMAKLTQHDPIYFACERCGTLTRIVGTQRTDYVPKLVERCREFAKKMNLGPLSNSLAVDEWRQIGIAESINFPEDRQPKRCPNCGGTEHEPPLPGTTGMRCVKCCNIKPEDRTT